MSRRFRAGVVRQLQRLQLFRRDRGPWPFIRLITVYAPSVCQFCDSKEHEKKKKRRDFSFSSREKWRKNGRKKGNEGKKRHLLPQPARSQVYKRAFYPPSDRTRPRCPTVESKGRTRNKLDDRSTLAPYARPEMVPILGRSPRISFQNACHTNNIQHFHITFVY